LLLQIVVVIVVVITIVVVIVVAIVVVIVLVVGYNTSKRLHDPLHLAAGGGASFVIFFLADVRL
jgi:hypothetical protein